MMSSIKLTSTSDNDLSIRQTKQKRYLEEYNQYGTVNAELIPCCKRCGNERTLTPLGEFYCSPCRTRSTLTYRSRNREVVKVYQTEWKKENYLYRIWLGANYRCHNPNYHNYSDYGARGINVFDAWRRSNSLSKEDNLKKCKLFEQYIRDNLGYRPSEEYSLDRIDNNGNYEPGNLKWSTRKEQANNQRKTISIRMGIADDTRLQYHDEIISLKQLSERTGIDLRIIKGRYLDAQRFVDEDKWKHIVDLFVEDRRYRYREVWYSLRELAVLAVVNRSTLRTRILSGKWSILDAVETPANGRVSE